MRLLIVLLILITSSVQSQNQILTFEEYLGYVKKYHPIVKQANLVLKEGEAKLLKSRGAFDPKLEVDFDKKQFKGSTYYDKLNASFKVPTWYGIELKASYEDNSGRYLNPELKLPEDGLYSVGVTISLAKNLFINERMSALKKAKFYNEQVKADRKLLVNQILYKASLAYFNWLKYYNEKLLYKSFIANADKRFMGVKKSFLEGDKAAIDTLETGIIVNKRKFNFEKATINYTKASLELANFLWLDNNTPIELQETMVPDSKTILLVDEAIDLNSLDSLEINLHPKMVSLDLKYKSQKIDKQLKTNRLLPQLDIEYNFLTENPRQINSLDQNQYKGGLNFKIPLFLRKERGDLKLSKAKLNTIQFEIENTRVSLSNKINAIKKEIISLENQKKYAQQIVADYEQLLKAEERKFFLGESSIFMINSRETKLIDSKLKNIEVINNVLVSKAKLANTLALQD